MSNSFCLSVLLILAFTVEALGQRGFVSVTGTQLRLNGKQYTFVGTNYWYGSLLPLEKDKKHGIERLRHELDFLKKHGVSNLRLMAGAEGSGSMNGVTRVGPSLQPEQGKFDDNVLKGLDVLLAEMGKRKMKAVIFLSNNWEWSGGFQQYLIWNKIVSDDLLTRKPDWDELRDVVAKFYTCEACIAAYRKQVEHVIRHINLVNKKRYTDDPTIMAWELANEPRPMRPAVNGAYLEWINDSAAYIKSLDHNHLVTTGSEGWIGTVDRDLFTGSHASRDVDYVTIHIWPKNWGWFTKGDMDATLGALQIQSGSYIDTNWKLTRDVNKPMIIEEFGLPRDKESRSFSATTEDRDWFYNMILSTIGTGNIVGANFWAFGGTARPIAGQPFWKPGDDRMGDPPMEEQGLNSVFESDASTWRVIDKHSRSQGSRRRH